MTAHLSKALLNPTFTKYNLNYYYYLDITFSNNFISYRHLSQKKRGVHYDLSPLRYMGEFVNNTLIEETPFAEKMG